jgi:hypothetical protein
MAARKAKTGPPKHQVINRVFSSEVLLNPMPIIQITAYPASQIMASNSNVKVIVSLPAPMGAL